MIKTPRTIYCLFLPTILLAGCDMYRSCATFCGCWKTTTHKYQTKIVDSQNAPVGGIELRCSDTADVVGSTNEDGDVAVRFRTKKSPGCGILTCGKLSVVQDQEHIGYISLRLTKSQTGTLRLEDIANRQYESHHRQTPPND